MLHWVTENFQGAFYQAFPVQAPAGKNMIIWKPVCLTHGQNMLRLQLAVGKGKGMKTSQRLLEKFGPIGGDGRGVNAAAQLGAKWIGSIETAFDGRFKLLPVGIHIFARIFQFQCRFRR